MLKKYTVGLLFLLLCNVALAQELNTVFYSHIHRQEIIKKSGKKRLQSWAEGTVVTGGAEVQLIYAPNHLLFVSPQRTDTVFLSKINKTEKYNFYPNRWFQITYNSKSDLINLLFCHRKNAKKFKRFVLKNGGQYKRHIVVKILFFPLIEIAKFETLILSRSQPPSKSSRWLDACQ